MTKTTKLPSRLSGSVGSGLTTPQLIAKKRDGGELTGAEIAQLIEGFTRGDVADYQMSAMAMAVFLRGMTPKETVALTLAMRDSGRIVDLSSVKGVKVDKHSTGGVGDKVSICLAPLVAACGVPIPMISGRLRRGESSSAALAIRRFSRAMSVRSALSSCETSEVPRRLCNTASASSVRP